MMRPGLDPIVILPFDAATVSGYRLALVVLALVVLDEPLAVAEAQPASSAGTVTATRPKVSRTFM
jgi:hypothetical protein